jgi:hypothetical protein
VTVDIGSGIAAAGCGMAMAAVLIKWIGRDTMAQKCDMHGAIAEQISSLRAWLEKIERKLDRVIEKL